MNMGGVRMKLIFKGYVFLLSVLKRMRRKPLLAHIILINMFV